MALEITLLQPAWLLALPLVWLWAHYWRALGGHWPSGGTRPQLRHPQAGLLRTDLAQADRPSGMTSGMAPGQQPRQPNSWPNSWPALITASTLSLCLLALSQPVYRAPITPAAPADHLNSAPDTILLVGTAVSMTLQDYQRDGTAISRMQASQDFLQSLIDDYPAERLALILMGDPPALWLPMTKDRAVLTHSIGRISPSIIGRLNDIGASLHLVRERFAANRATRVLMLTDGNLHIGNIAPEQAAKDLAGAGFHLDVIAIGGGNDSAQQIDSDGLIYARTDVDYLQTLATAGGGKLFIAPDSDSLRHLSQQLVGPEAQAESVQAIRKAKSVSTNAIPQPLYPWVLSLALLLQGGGWLYGQVRRRGRA